MVADLDLDTLRRFGVALMIGGLIGLEREKKRTADRALATGGLRTFLLYAQIGALSALLTQELGSPWPLAAALLAVAAGVVAGYLVQVRTASGGVGLTTEMAALGTFILGALVVLGHEQLAVAMAIVMAAILWLKDPLHRAVGSIASDDIHAGLKLLFATFVVLPVLPDRPLDPWGALNPYKLWLLVVLISSLSLVGYIAVRVWGQHRGIVLTSLAGGLVSSTAVTLSFARRSRDVAADRGLGSTLAGGILLAWAIMFVRVVVMVAVVHRPMLERLAVPMTAMAVTAALASVVMLRRRAPGAVSEDLEVRNPFNLTSAIKFGILFAVVQLAVELVEQYLPPKGLLAVAALAGATDVDAISLSVARLASEGTAPPLPTAAVTVATISNTLVKTAMAASLGSSTMRRAVVVAGVLVLTAGAVPLIVQAGG